MAERPLLVVRGVREHDERRERRNARHGIHGVRELLADGDEPAFPAAARPRGRDQRGPAACLADQRRRQRLDGGESPAVGVPVPEQTFQPVRGEQLVAQLLELQPAQLVETVGRLPDRPSLNEAC